MIFIVTALLSVFLLYVVASFRRFRVELREREKRIQAECSEIKSMLSTQLPKSQVYQIKKNDIGIVSYPRSGNTWLRAILVQAYYGYSGESLSDLDFFSPDIHQHRPSHSRLNSDFHFVKSHDPFWVGTETKPCFKKVVYLSRDPRDVVLSHFEYYKNFRSYKENFETFFDNWIEGMIWPGSWESHFQSWKNAKETEIEMLFVNYENLIENTFTEVKRILSFCQFAIPDETIKKAILENTPDKMRLREEKGLSEVKRKPESHFVGAAVQGRWATELNPIYIDKMNKKFRNSLASYTMH